MDCDVSVSVGDLFDEDSVEFHPVATLIINEDDTNVLDDGHPYFTVAF